MGKIKIGDEGPARMRLGDTAVSKAFMGDEPVFNQNRFRVTIKESLSSTVVTLNGTAVRNLDAVPYGSHVQIDLSYAGNSSMSFSVRQGSGAVPKYFDLACTRLKASTVAGRYYFIMPADNVTISSSSINTCLPSGTMIALADGTRKAVENVTTRDRVLVFNHETGAFDGAGIIFMEDDGVRDWTVLRLRFADGSGTGLIFEHGYFDLDLMRYVYIREDNYGDFIGHRFARRTAAGGIEGVELTGAEIGVERTGCYSFPSVYHLNFVADDFLSMPGGITGMFNFFDYGEGLKYEEAAKAADIAAYGLMRYEDLAAQLTREEFDAYPAPYLRVALGKGVMTQERLAYLIERYVVEKR